MKRVIQVTIALGLIGLSLAGCSSFLPKPNPNATRIFVLFPDIEAAERQNSDPSTQISLGVGPVRLPAYLDRREIVMRVAPSRFDLSENDRWAEPLDENLTRVLAQNLSILLGSDQIIPYPWPLDQKPHYRVEIQVLRFESDSAGEIQLSARWTVIDDTGKETPNQKASRLTRRAKEKSTDGSIAALSETVADLSREIAKTIIAVDRQREGSGKDFSLRSK